MALDKKKINVKNLIEKGHIQTFKEILEYYNITPIIDHLGSSHQRVTKLFNQIGLFKIREIDKLADYFNVDVKLMFNLVYNQIIEEKKNPPTPRVRAVKKKPVKKNSTN
ncbi:hypothetical protein [Niabella aquatica]